MPDDTPSDPAFPSPPLGPLSRLLAPFRAAFRLGTALAVTLLTYPLLEVTNPLLRSRPRWREAVQARVLRLWGRAVARALGARVERRGRLPQAPFLLVSNHLSYLDVPLLAETGGRFIAKAEIRSWPVAGRVAAAAGVIFIDRSSKRDLVRVGREIERSLERGRGVVLFPEGTTGPGDALLPFRPSLLVHAARSALPVHHAVISYRTAEGEPPPQEVVCWWGNEPLAPHLARLVTIRPFEARVVYGEASIRDRDRKRLAERLRQAMEEIFEPSCRHPERRTGPFGDGAGA